MGRAKALSVATSGRIVRAARRTSHPARLEWREPLRGRLMVGRLTLDQVVKVRVLAPQPPKAPLTRGCCTKSPSGGFLSTTRRSGRDRRGLGLVGAGGPR